MFRGWVVGAALLTVGCASQRSSVDGRAEGPAEGARYESFEARRLANRSYFDLANCWPRTIEVPAPANLESLTGALLASRPQALECLVDPAHRGPAETTDVTLSVSANAHGVTFTATGENLTEAGSRCIEDGLRRDVSVSPLPAGSAPITTEVQVQHAVRGPLPAVQLGVNDESNLVGQLRLDTRNWCECFAEWRSARPEELRAELSGTRLKLDATFVPAKTEAGQKVAACVEPRIEQLTVTISREQVKVPYRITLINSYSDDVGGIVERRLQFLQLDHRRGQAQADSAIALGVRNSALTAYDTLVAKLENAKDLKLMDELQARCRRLQAADDAWVRAVDEEVAVGRNLLAKLGELKAFDPLWAAVEDAARDQLAATEKLAADVKRIREEDEAACPNLRPGKRWSDVATNPTPLVLIAPLGVSSADLERRFSARMSEEYRRANRILPFTDDTLTQAARRLASHALRMDPDAHVDSGAVVGALFGAGGWDPEVRWVVIRTDNPDLALEMLERRRDLADATATHFGISVAKRDKETAMVAVLAERWASLSPFPRRLDKAPATQTLCGSVDHHFSHPYLFVTGPDGKTAIVQASRHKAPMFCEPLQFPAPGRYWVELGATSSAGPKTLARFIVEVAE